MSLIFNPLDCQDRTNKDRSCERSEPRIINFEPFFSQQDDLEVILKNALECVKESMDIALYTITLDCISNTIKKLMTEL